MRLRPLALLAAAAVVFAPVAAADWAQFHADSVNSGTTASTHDGYEGIWWSLNGGAEVRASPVLKGGRLIAADMAGNVRALDAESGFEFWSHKMAAGVEATPAIAGDHVYVVDTAGNLKSLSLLSGAVEATAKAAAARGAIAEHEGKIFFGTESGEVHAYRDDLTVLWKFKTSDIMTGKKTVQGNEVCDPATTIGAQAVRGKPAIYDGKVFFGSYNHFLIAVDEAGVGNGKTTVQWIFRTGDLIEAAPAIAVTTAGTRLFAGSYDGKLYALAPSPAGAGSDPCFGLMVTTPSWTFPVPSSGQNQASRIHSSPAVADGKVFFGANNGKVYAVHAHNGTRVWDQVAGNEILKVTASPAVSNGLVVVGSEDQSVYWMDAATGAVRTTFPTQSAFKASPAIGSDKAFVAALDGTWYAFGPPVPDRADLVVAFSKAPEAKKITVTVTNVGRAASEPTTVRVATGNTVIDEPVGALTPGQAQTIVHTNVTIAKAKNVKFTAVVDGANLVKESDESNNRAETTVEIKAPAPTPVAPPPATTSGKGKIPAWDLAVPIALLGVGLLLRRRIR